MFVHLNKVHGRRMSMLESAGSVFQWHWLRWLLLLLMTCPRATGPRELDIVDLLMFVGRSMIHQLLDP